MRYDGFRDDNYGVENPSQAIFNLFIQGSNYAQFYLTYASVGMRGACAVADV